MIGNIKELKQDIIDAIQEECQKILESQVREEARKRSAENARMFCRTSKEKIEIRNRARNTYT